VPTSLDADTVEVGGRVSDETYQMHVEDYDRQMAKQWRRPIRDVDYAIQRAHADAAAALGVPETTSQYDLDILAARAASPNTVDCS
jgi:hypothetical protein